MPNSGLLPTHIRTGRPVDPARVNALRRRADVLETEAERCRVQADWYEVEQERAQARRDLYPEADPFEDGTLLRFDKRFGSKSYSYAAIRTDGLWYSTGPKAPKGFTWAEMVEFWVDGVDEVWIVSEYL